MIKVKLRDDPAGYAAGHPIPATGDGSGSPIYLDGDTGGYDLAPTLAEVRQRFFNDYDDNGDPYFTWETVVTGEVVAFTMSSEIDQFTSIRKGTLTVLYSGTTNVTEGAVVVDSDGLHYAVVGVNCPPGRLELTLERVEGTNAEE